MFNPFEYSNLDWSPGICNTPGIWPDVYHIKKVDISAWPELPTSPASAALAPVYVGNFSLEVGKTWKKLFADVNKSPVTSETQGEKFSKSHLNKGIFKYPGNEEEATAFAGQAINDDEAFLIKEKSSGKWRVIGNEMFQCDVLVSQAIGGAPTDEKGTTIEVTVTDHYPPPFYDGEIITDDGDINPSS